MISVQVKDNFEYCSSIDNYTPLSWICPVKDWIVYLSRIQILTVQEAELDG